MKVYKKYTKYNTINTLYITMATSAAKITLQCVKSGKKLRIRFFSFTDEAGKVFTNVYNNGLNCKFPRDIRVEGRFFEIGPNDLELVNHPGKSPICTMWAPLHMCQLLAIYGKITSR